MSWQGNGSAHQPLETFEYLPHGRHPAHLQGHEQRLSFHVCETQVDTTRVSVRITVPHYVLDLCVDTVDQSIAKGDDTNMVGLIQREMSVKLSRQSPFPPISNPTSKRQFQPAISTPAQCNP